MNDEFTHTNLSCPAWSAFVIVEPLSLDRFDRAASCARAVTRFLKIGGWWPIGPPVVEGGKHEPSASTRKQKAHTPVTKLRPLLFDRCQDSDSLHSLLRFTFHRLKSISILLNLFSRYQFAGLTRSAVSLTLHSGEASISCSI